MTNDYNITNTDHTLAHSSTTWDDGGTIFDVGGVTTSAKLMINGVDIDGIYQKKEENMRGLYRIIVVNPKTEEIGDPFLVIAKDEAGALVKAALKGVVKGKVEDYDILIDRLGDVRAKKDVQKVKVIKEEEEDA